MPSQRNEFKVKHGTIFTKDNIDVLLGMNSEVVDLVYLDPPFNSQRKYFSTTGPAKGSGFNDTWRLSDLSEMWRDVLKIKHPDLAFIAQMAGRASGESMEAYVLMMSMRLIELHRVLKQTGSLYLHCDSTASHYLKVVMDRIFGEQNYRNEIVWKRANSHNDGRRYGKIHDLILFYTKSDDYTWTKDAKTPYSKEYIESHYKHVENGRRYQKGPVDFPGGGGYEYDLGMGEKMPKRGYAMPSETAQEWLESGELIVEEGKVPRRKLWLEPDGGVPLQDIFLDIGPLTGRMDEYTGYKTQKPRALLERIIKASSNEGDLVLDPFCGCATTMIAAENLKRRWIGIDSSPKAVELVQRRIRELYGEMTKEGQYRMEPTTPIPLSEAPLRTDNADLPDYRIHRSKIYGDAGGNCAVCGEHKVREETDVDHILPKQWGGTDHPENLQLICVPCHRNKTVDERRRAAALRAKVN